MKVVLSWESFRDALQLISQLTPGKPNLGEPCLVQITAIGETVEMFSSDYDCMIRYELEDGIEVKEEGSLTLPCQPLTSFVRDLQTKKVELFTRSEDVCVITANGDSLELVAVPEIEREVPPDIDPKNSFEVATTVFADLIEKCAFAVSKDDRRGLNGVRLEVFPDRMRMVATDTRRLALAEAPLEDAPENLSPVVLPTRIVSQLMSAVRGEGEVLRVSLLSTQTAFSTRGLTVFTRVLQAKFPEKYASIIPTRTANTCLFSPTEMVRKLRLVANMSSDELRAVEFQISSSSVTLLAASPGQGTAKAEVAVTFKGVVDRLKYNPDYLLDALKRADAEEVELSFEQANTPGKFTLGKGFTYVVMPINV